MDDPNLSGVFNSNVHGSLKGHRGCSWLWLCPCVTSFQTEGVDFTWARFILLIKVKVKSLSRVWLFVTPWTVAYQVPPSIGFSRQECWSGLPFPSPGDLPDTGIEPRSPTLQADTLPSEPPKNGADGYSWKILSSTSAYCISLKLVQALELQSN